MGEAKDASPSAAPTPAAQGTMEAAAKGPIDHPAASAASPPMQPPVPGVPVSPGPYDASHGPGQDRPADYGSYHAQGPPGTAGYPYDSQVPQSFGVTEAHWTQQRLPCGIGYQLILFTVGWFFPILWYIGAFIPLCGRRIDPREKTGWLINSICAAIFTIIIILVVTEDHNYFKKFGIYDDWNRAASAASDASDSYDDYLASKQAWEASHP